jgi:MinD-like ATPase involved in chromosome partitioning or flagellar assembly
MESARRSGSRRDPGPWQPSEASITVVAGVAAGIGTSTVAALIGNAIAQAGHRALLVDSSGERGGLRRVLGAAPTRGIAALLDPAVSMSDLLVEVAAGCQLLPGGTDAEPRRGAIDPAAQRTMLRRAAQEFHAFDAVVIDAGARLDTILAATERGVRRVLVVGGVTPAQIAAAYALLKALDLRWPSIAVDLLVNRQEAEAARAAFEQVHYGAQHFLARGLGFAGSLADDAGLGGAPDLPLYRCGAETAVAVHQLAAACVADSASTLS